MKNIQCSLCGSYSIKKEHGPEDFLYVKEEGEKAKVGKPKIKQKYRCWDCEKEWEEAI